MEDLWNTWHDNRFDCEKYLYHYTTVENACKIMFHKCLRFSKLTMSNDTIESKIKMEFKNDGTINDFDERCDYIRNYMRQQNEHIQILCFSMDMHKSAKKKIYTKEDDRYFIDMTGRGFSLPRMWAQYAGNSSGVCLIINKNKFEEALNKQYDIIRIRDGRISYKDVFSLYRIPADIVKCFSMSIQEDKDAIVSGYSFLLKNKDYVDYAYFTKYKDWNNENEYRYLIGRDNSILKEIKGLDYLEGVVVGEKIDSVDEWKIKNLIIRLNDCKNIHEGTQKSSRVEIKKICFDYKYNRLIDIDM